jgi:hypothetical protein
VKNLPFIILLIAALAVTGCSGNKKKAEDRDSVSVSDSVSKTPVCPPETVNLQRQTIEVEYEGDCQYCSFSVEGAPAKLLVPRKKNKFEINIGGEDICTLFRINTGQGRFRALITINGKTQIVEQEITEMLEEIQRSFSFSDFGISPIQTETTDPNTTP